MDPYGTVGTDPYAERRQLPNHVLGQQLPQVAECLHSPVLRVGGRLKGVNHATRDKAHRPLAHG